MYYLVKKIFFVIIINSSLFFILVTGIQNSSNRSKVDLIFDKTRDDLNKIISDENNVR